MSRSQRLRDAIEECRRALSRDSNFALSKFLAAHGDLQPELGNAVEELQRSRKSFQTDGTLLPEASSGGKASSGLESTIDIASPPDAQRQVPTHLKYVGEFRLEELLGSGTFGDVWKATQTTLSRTVAVKTLKREHLSPDLLHRFHREARALARLAHPNIVSVLEIGEHQGTHYIAMEFVDGVDLKRVLEQGLPTAQWAAKAMQTVALAIAHAHEANLIHRDLKPANILVNKRMDLKVTDFGLARQTTDATELTSDGDVLGTLSYMAPEQARGRTEQVGPAADIYALGATLYHLLTGRPPFPLRPHTPTFAVLEEVQDKDPVAPRIARPDGNIPRDLETICLHCLEKEPSRRYATAQELAADLGRFLEGEPIVARPTHWADRLWRKVRKRPVVAGLSAAVVAVTLTGILVASSLASRGSKLARQVEKTKEQVVTVSSQRDTERKNKELAEQKKAIAEQEREAAQIAEAWKEYAADLQLMQIAWDGGKMNLLRDLLAKHEPRNGRRDLRGIEWYYWKDKVDRASRVVPGIRGRSFALSPDGLHLAAADDAHVTLWNVHTGKQLGRWPIGNGRISRVIDPSDQHAENDRSVAFSREGKLLAATTYFTTKDKRLGSVRVWEVPSGTERFSILEDPLLSGRAVAFSPDSKYVVAGGYENQWKSWNLATKQEESEVKEQPGNFGPPVSRPKPGDPWSGRRVVWDLGFQRDILMSRCDFTPPRFVRWNRNVTVVPPDEITPAMHRKLGGPTLSLYDRDNRNELYAAGVTDDDSLALYAFGNPRVKGVQTTRLEGGAVSHLASSGPWLAAAGRDNVVRVWHVNLNFTPKEFRGAEGVSGLAFGHDLKGEPRSIAVLCADGVRIWPLADREDFQLPLVQAGTPGQPVYAQSPQGTFAVRLRPPKLVLEQSGGSMAEIAFQQIMGAWFSPDERFCAIALMHDKKHKTLLWNTETKQQVAELPGFQFAKNAGAFSPDSRYVAGRSSVWDCATGQEALKCDQPPALCTSFAPQGRLVAFGSMKQVDVWNLEKQERVFTAPVGGKALAVDAEGKLLVAVGDETTVWDLISGQQFPSAFGNLKAESLAFSDNGERLYLLSGNQVNVYSTRGWNHLAAFSCNAPKFASELEPLFKQVMGKETR